MQRCLSEHAWSEEVLHHDHCEVVTLPDRGDGEAAVLFRWEQGGGGKGGRVGVCRGWSLHH